MGLVIGALLGTQDGRNIEIFNSFELQFDLFDDGQIVINMEYYKTKEEQCKFVILYYRKFMHNELIKVLEINTTQRAFVTYKGLPLHRAKQVGLQEK